MQLNQMKYETFLYILNGTSYNADANHFFYFDAHKARCRHFLKIPISIHFTAYTFYTKHHHLKYRIPKKVCVILLSATARWSTTYGENYLITEVSIKI